MELKPDAYEIVVDVDVKTSQVHRDWVAFATGLGFNAEVYGYQSVAPMARNISFRVRETEGSVSLHAGTLDSQGTRVVLNFTDETAEQLADHLTAIVQRRKLARQPVEGSA